MIYKEIAENVYSPIFSKESSLGDRKVELRSEKVRNIIGQVPPALLRYGIMIIGGALLVLVGVSAFIPYQPAINVGITVTQSDNGTLQYSTRIPKSAMKYRAKFDGVVLNSSSEMPLPALFEIENISDIVEVSEQDAWQSATLTTKNKIYDNVILAKPITVSGKILLEKHSVMRWIIRR